METPVNLHTIFVQPTFTLKSPSKKHLFLISNIFVNTQIIYCCYRITSFWYILYSDLIAYAIFINYTILALLNPPFKRSYKRLQRATSYYTFYYFEYIIPFLTRKKRKYLYFFEDLNNPFFIVSQFKKSIKLAKEVLVLCELKWRWSKA